MRYIRRMKKTGLRHSITALLLIVFISGCAEEKKEIAGFDALSSRLLLDSLRSIREEKHEEAIQHLGRLNELTESYFISELQQQQRERQVVDAVNEVLSEDDLDTAYEELETQIRKYGLSPYLKRQREYYRAVLSIRDFQNKKPFQRSATMAAAITQLPNPIQVKNYYPYILWYNSQRQRLIKLREKEKTILSAELMKAMDLALVTDNSRLQSIDAELLMLDSRHAFIKGLDEAVYDTNFAH